MYAIIETGGKQFKVKEGDTIRVEKLSLSEGEAFVFDKVLAIGESDKSVFGSPYVKGACVAANAVKDGKAKKVIVYKYKSKKGFHKKKGHRQPYTEVKIGKITAK